MSPCMVAVGQFFEDCIFVDGQYELTAENNYIY